MNLELEHIELPGGGWAKVYKDVLRKTARLHEAELRKYMTPYNPDCDPSKVLRSTLKANPALGIVDYYIDFVAVDAATERINEIFILNQTVDWSFGPVTAEVLEEHLTRDQYQVFVEVIDRLYKPNPLLERSGLVTSAKSYSGPCLKVKPCRPKQGKLTTLWKWIRNLLR